MSQHADKIKLAIGVLGFIAVGYLVYALAFAPSGPGERSRTRVLIDIETGKLFEGYKIPEGESPPYENPETGERTLIQAEKCFWTKDDEGNWAAKLEPTYVLLNNYKGEPGPTYCPDCGREVVGHNPAPPNDLMLAAVERAQKDKD